MGQAGCCSIELPAVGIFTCWMVSFKECTHFENKRCTLHENNVFIIKLFNFYIYLLTFPALNIMHNVHFMPIFFTLWILDFFIDTFTFHNIRWLLFVDIK